MLYTKCLRVSAVVNATVTVSVLYVSGKRSKRDCSGTMDVVTHSPRASHRVPLTGK